MTDSALGTWDSRYAMRHVRTYPHPIDLVWEAVTTAEHLNAWMLPKWTVDLRIGGVCTATYGDTADPPAFKVDHVIIELDPPRVVDYGGLRFELEPVDGGNSTRLDVHPVDAAGGDGRGGSVDPRLLRRLPHHARPHPRLPRREVDLRRHAR